jgi:O-antigen ligase
MSVVNGRLLTRRARRLPASAAASTLALSGLFIFTFFLVTARFPSLFTEFGIYLALLGLLLRPDEISFPAPVRWAMALVLWGLVTTFTAISPETAYGSLIELLKALVIFFVVMNALRTPQQLRSYILLFLAAFLVWPARGALTNYVTGNRYFGRAIWNGIYANPNDLAAITLLVLGLTLAIATVKTQNPRVRRAAIAFVPVTVLILLLTQSRGAFIGLVVGFGPTIFSRMRKRPTIAGPVLIVVLLAALLVPSTAWQRFEDITKVTSSETIREADQYGSAAQRLDILKVGWHIFTDHPLLGVGIGCYNEANAHYAPKLGRRDAHNTYISLAAEMGVPGLVLWLGLVGSVLAQVRRRRQSIEADDRMIQIVWLERAIVGCLVAAFFASYSGITIFYLLLGTLWAASRVLGRDATDAGMPPAPGPPRAARALRVRAPRSRALRSRAPRAR